MDVAVIIPTVDRPGLLRAALYSATEQTVWFKQIIVVNDGPKPIDYLPNIPELKIVSTKGAEGLPAARATGLAALDPSIQAVCYLDDDDELLPNHVESLLPALKNGAQFAFSKACFVYPDGTKTEDPEPNNHSPKRYYDPNALLTQNIAPVSSFIHTVYASNEIGGWDKNLIRMEDWDFWARMFIRFGPPVFVNEVTNVIRKGTPGNLTDSSKYSYSMACSWRDIVSDRIKAMAAEKRSVISESDRTRFHIPRLGVIMPVYNAEKYLSQAIDSILKQSFTDLELICINDGSTDSSRKIIEDFAAKDRRVRLFDMPGNCGVTKALNFGLLVSRSEYLARMDADDISLLSRLSRQVEFLDANRDIMLVGTFFRSWTENMVNIIWVNNEIPTDPEKIKERLLYDCCIGHPTVMMRRRIIEMVGGYDENPEYKAVEDYELWLRISRRFKIANLPEILLEYRESDQQVSKVLMTTQKENAEKLRRRYRKM